MADTTIPFPKPPKPAITVVLWDGTRAPFEEELRVRLQLDGFQPVKWTSEPLQRHLAHAHIFPETLWVVTGSVTVILPAEKRMLELFPGDRLVIPPGILHASLAGAEGATYLLATK